MSIILAFYRLLIRLYPRPFREKFGAEMEAVIQEQLADAAAQGEIPFLQVCWRELRDWPRHCLQVHWQARQQRLAAATISSPSWWETAVSSFPYFLFAIFVSSSAFVFLFGQATGLFVGLVFSFGFVFLLLLVLLIAWWRGWPVWSAAWLGFLFFALFVLFVPGQLFGLLGQPVQMLLSEVGFPLLWLAVLYVLLARWPRAGLVAMLLPFGITWLFYLEFVPESVSLVVMAISWIWLGVIAIVLLRWRHPAWDVWLLYLAGAVTGAVYTMTGHYLTEIQVRSGTLAGVGEDVLKELIPVLIPMVGILLLHTLRQWSAGNGRYAVHSYRFLLTGIVLTSIGLQTSLVTVRRSNFLWSSSIIVLFTAVLLLGCLLMGFAVWRFIRQRKQWSLPLGWLGWLLLSLLLLLPFLSNLRWLTIAYGFQGWQVLRLINLCWLVVAAWLIGHMRQQIPSMPTPKEPTPVVPCAHSGGNGRVNRWQKIMLILALFWLVALLLPATTLAILFPNNQSQPFDLPTAFPLFGVMTAGLIMAAILLASGVNLYQAAGRKTAVFFIALSLFLIIAAPRNFYWLILWDSTYDGFGYFWLFVPVTAVFFTAIWLTFKLPDKMKLVAFCYLLLLPPALIMISRQAQRVDFRQVTEARAARITQTLANYYVAEGHYPENLDQLTPGHLLSLSEPMIIFGQSWCYEGRGDVFQFGYVDRTHWSDPNLFGHIQSTTGDEAAATLPALCEQEIMALQARDPQYYGLRHE